MKKAKRLAIIVCAIAMLMSILASPASAATNDHYHTFSWEGSQRYASVTTVWRKANNSPTYFRVENDSMPLDGFYIQTTLAPYGGTQAATSSYFLITTYGGKTIKHNKTATNLMAGLRTYYPSSHYSWGNVTLAWSEDYVEDGSERLNW